MMLSFIVFCVRSMMQVESGRLYIVVDTVASKRKKTNECFERITLKNGQKWKELLYCGGPKN